MSSPKTTTTLAIDTWPIRTVRWAAGLIIVSSFLKLADLNLITHLPMSPDIANAQLDIVIGCVLLTLTFTGVFRDHWRSITFVGSSLIIASDALTGAMHGETVLFLMSLMLMMMGTGAMLPWSVRWQGAFNLLCIAAWSAARLSAGRHDTDEATEWAGVLTAAAIAQVVTAMRERYVRDRERAERKVRESEEKLRQVLIEAREQALAASRAKSDFLSSMSHEIRTPLNFILGMAELMLETPHDPEQRRYLDTMLDNGTAMLGLVNDVLDLARVESGKLTLEQVNFDLAELIARLTETIVVRARQKELVFTARIDPDVPTALVGDPFRLRQILVNLIGNATKFTDRGSVALTASRDPIASESGYIRFSIADTGIGIAQCDLEQIFATFAQADSSTARKYGGSGLGLSIAKQLVELMGGKIWAESELEIGSTFHFTARFNVQPATTVTDPPTLGNGDPQASRAAAPPCKPLRILVADDSPDNRMLITAFLKNTPYRIDEVENGALAVEHFMTQHYDLVLMDIQMPVMDGHAAARAIRDFERNNHRAPTPIVALSAAALSDSFISSRAAGCDQHVTKPIRKAALLDVIDRATTT